MSKSINRKVSRSSFALWIGAFSVAIATLNLAPQSWAVTILSPPTITPSAIAPLAGLLKVTTDVKARVNVQVDNGAEVWAQDFYTYSKSNAIPLLGFKPKTTNTIQVTVYDAAGNSTTAMGPVTFVTAALPALFPKYTVLQNQPSQREPGYTFFMVRNGSTTAYIAAMDTSNNVVWYMQSPSLYYLDVERLDNGNIFIPYGSTFTELNMLGNTVQTWTVPTGHGIDAHDGYPTSHGTILYLSGMSELVTNMPTSDTISNPPVKTENVADSPAVEISITNSALLNVWSPFSVLEPTRVTYLTYGIGSGSTGGVDNEHGNAVVDDTNDNSIIISLRNQNAVIKIDRTTKQLRWILGPPDNWGPAWQPFLLTPVGTPFDWNYGQHAPSLTPAGTLILYNDNNYEASPPDPSVADQDNHSSAIEYSIDETNMQVSEVWNSAWQTNQDRLFTPYVGMVDWLPQTQDILVNYGAVSYINGVSPSTNAVGANMVRFIEYTHDPVPQVVSDVSFFDYTNTSASYQGDFVYRAYHIADLYPHPAEPVVDLSCTMIEGIAELDFSGDPIHSYLVQTSTDLVNWSDLGTASAGDISGTFQFDDVNASEMAGQFYRVVTQ